jgi:hypothetical protein
MKKLTALLVMGLLALPVFAQQPQKQETPSPSPILHSTVFTAQDGLLSINLMDHVFFGYNIVDADAFTPNGGGELSLNTLALNVSPAPSFGFQVGMDCKWQFFSTQDSRFFLDKTKIPQVTPWPNSTELNQAQAQAQEQTALPEESMTSKYRGSLHTFTLAIPVLATLHLNDNFWFSAGAEANLNMTSWTNFHEEKGDVTATTSVADGQVRPFTFNFMGMIGFRDTALFFKYYPKTSRIVPDGGVVFDYCSVGVTLFL